MQAFFVALSPMTMTASHVGRRPWDRPVNSQKIKSNPKKLITLEIFFWSGELGHGLYFSLHQSAFGLMMGI
jgi:hypothetical protein